MKYIILVFSLLYPLIINAQKAECGFIGVDSIQAKSLNYYGNNKYLEKVNLLHQKKQQEKLLKFNKTLNNEYKNDNLEKMNTVCSQSVSYHLPLRIVVHRDIDNNTFITNQTIEELLEETNLRLLQSGTDVRFYLIRSPVYINNSEFANGDLTNAQELDMFVAQHNSNQFTMHLVDDGGGSAVPPNLPFNSNSWVGSQDVDNQMLSSLI